MMKEKTVAVIGAGIVGVSTAIRARERGFRVVLIDREKPGFGSSFGNAGCLNPSSIVPMSMPGTLTNVPKWLSDPHGPLALRLGYLPQIAPWLIRFIRAGTKDNVAGQARALRTLLGTSVEEMTALARDAGASNLVHQTGHLVVYRSEASFAKDHNGWQLRRDNGVEMRLLDARKLREFDPALSHDFVRGVFMPANGYIANPQRLVRRFAERLLELGGELLTAHATGFAFHGARLRAVETSAGEIKADKCVIAAGAYSGRFARLAGDRIPLDTERGYHVQFPYIEGSPRVPTMDAERKCIATPMNEGMRMAGVVEFGGVDASPNWRHARGLIRHAKDMFPGLGIIETGPFQMWMGRRPSVPDSLPVIDRSSRSPDIVYGFGHGHVGMTGGPKSAKILTDLLSGATPDIDISPFSARRF